MKIAILSSAVIAVYALVVYLIQREKHLSMWQFVKPHVLPVFAIAVALVLLVNWSAGALVF